MSAKRVFNFNPGPATLPLPVLEKAQREMLDYQGTGMSVMEISHRSKEFEAIIQTAEADLRELLAIPANYKVMFLQGGASMQFAMLAMNLRPAGASADYIVTGSWGKKAFDEAGRLGTTRAAANTKASNFDHLPAQSELDLDPKAAYLHFTSNETIQGIEYFSEPVPPSGVPLVCDASSNFISHPLEVAKYGLIYAGAQKNAGPAGVVIAILREDLIGKVENLPAILGYKTYAEDGSLYNTPPCFNIYIVGLVLKWVKEIGGLAEVERRNRTKAGLVYDVIDTSGGFYRGHAKPENRSRMNITFRLPTEELEAQFTAQAKQNDLIGLKGHRSVGGIRASLYNALPVEGAQALAQFMGEFQQKNG